MGVSVLHQDRWCTLSHDDTFSLVRYERTAEPYGDFAEMDASYRQIEAALVRAPADSRLLIDMRLAPPRNDEGFEARAASAVEGLTRRFTRYATLVRTAVGKLHTLRIGAQVGREVHVFLDEAEALAYLARP